MMLLLDRVHVNGADLEIAVRGLGEPILFVQTALSADELLPIARQPVLGDGFQTIVYHRRGYGGSSAVAGLGSIVQDAADGAALLDSLAIEQAHVVGLSFSGAIAIQLASAAPERVRTLTLIEPPPVHVPGAAAFRAANTRLLEIRRAAGVGAALDQFLTMLVGPQWRTEVERGLPGSVAQMERDAATFFDTDIPALLEWQFTPADAGRITAPVLYVGGADSGPLFAEVKDADPDLAAVGRGCDDHRGRPLARDQPPQARRPWLAFFSGRRRCCGSDLLKLHLPVGDCGARAGLPTAQSRLPNDDR
jgi:pimeloyl-ACP methyl ester carboxylesterase